MNEIFKIAIHNNLQPQKFNAIQYSCIIGTLDKCNHGKMGVCTDQSPATEVDHVAHVTDVLKSEISHATHSQMTIHVLSSRSQTPVSRALTTSMQTILRVRYPGHGEGT